MVPINDSQSSFTHWRDLLNFQKVYDSRGIPEETTLTKYKWRYNTYIYLSLMFFILGSYKVMNPVKI